MVDLPGSTSPMSTARHVVAFLESLGANDNDNSKGDGELLNMASNNNSGFFLFLDCFGLEFFNHDMLNLGAYT